MSDGTKKYWLDRDDDSNTRRRKKQRFDRCSVKNLNFELEMHLVVFVSVSRRDHVTACDELGEYWLTLTRGWGDYDNGNRYAHSHKNKWGVAVGYLYRDDDKLSGRRKFGAH